MFWLLGVLTPPWHVAGSLQPLPLFLHGALPLIYLSL